MPTHFKIRTLNYVGIGDQLGTQFSRLYLLGEELNLLFEPSPMQFPRSYTPRLEIVVLNIKILICLKVLKLRLPKVVEKSLLAYIAYLSKALIWLIRKTSSKERVQRFLGLYGFHDKRSHENDSLIFVSNYLSICNNKKELLHLIKISKPWESSKCITLCWDELCYKYAHKFEMFFNGGGKLKATSFYGGHSIM